MKIAITGLSETLYSRQLELVTQLFFELFQIDFVITQSNDEYDLNFFFEVTTTNSLIEVSARLNANDIVHNAKEVRRKDCVSEENSEKRVVKQTISYVFLDLLQQYTGVKQPWGILTGIRPTKLYHKKLMNNVAKEVIGKELKQDLMISDEKINLMREITDQQLKAIPDLYNLKKEVSIYIGIPFCPTKCAYCTFPAYAINGRQGSVDSFLGGLHYEMRTVGKWLTENGIKVTTIYFGGGTPTSITAEEMDMLYEEMYSSFPNIRNVREVTVEAGRPDTITEKKLEILTKWNIDRISINPQSYTQATLKAIGRHHTVEETIEKFHLARSMGMKNINMDLIIGLPGEGVNEFQHTLQETEKLMPESLTVHTLSFKRASEMTKNKQKYKVADRKEISQMMKLASEWTTAQGYKPYYLYRQKNILGNLENVGYALPTQESLYNIMIMEEQQTIIGLGCGAASKFVDPINWKISRFANPKDPKSYNERYEYYTDEKIRLLSELFLQSTK